jgi:hypothetical protein
MHSEQHLFGGVCRQLSHYDFKDVGRSSVERLYMLSINEGFGYHDSFKIVSDRHNQTVDLTLITGLPAKQAKGLNPDAMLSLSVPQFTHRTLTLRTLGTGGIESPLYFIEAFVQLRNKDAARALACAGLLIDAVASAYMIPRTHDTLYSQPQKEGKANA